MSFSFDITGKQRLEQVFSGRQPLTPDEFYQKYFESQGYAKFVVLKVKEIFQENIDFDLSRISSKDDFSKELNFIWDFDSMADVEIVISLEKAFKIQITDAEATAMKTLSDVIHIVSTKIQTEQGAAANP
jgi:acyl carrier protein